MLNFFLAIVPYIKTNATACVLAGACLFYVHENFISRAQAQETFSKRFQTYEQGLDDIKMQIVIDKYEQQIFSLEQELSRYNSLIDHGKTNPMYVERIGHIKSELGKIKRKLSRIGVVSE